jgi:hypothetical protein
MSEVADQVNGDSDQVNGDSNPDDMAKKSSGARKRGIGTRVRDAVSGRFLERGTEKRRSKTTLVERITCRRPRQSGAFGSSPPFTGSHRPVAICRSLGAALRNLCAAVCRT